MKNCIMLVTLTTALILIMQTVSLHTLADGNTETGVVKESSSEFNELPNYSDYILAHQGKSNSIAPFVVGVNKAIEFKDARKETYDKTEGILLNENGEIRYSFSVEKEGLYQIEMSYYNIPGNGSNYNLEWKIDGNIPFEEMKYHTLYRAWSDEYTLGEKADNRGNHILPSQVEIERWQTAWIEDTTGSYTEPYRFYLTEGEHIVSVTSKRGTLVIGNIMFTQKNELISYDKLKEQYEKAGYLNTTENMTYEAEKVLAKSDSTLYASNDKASPLTTPYSTTAIMLNIIGGTNYSKQGQWLEWEINVGESALYRITFRARQNQLSGAYVSRRLYIDGEVPCKEFDNIHFNYSMNWQNVSLPEVYLEKGKHILRLVVTISDLGEIVSKVENSVSELNSAYRKIIMITGTAPDSYRDYALEENEPEVFEIFREQMQALRECNTELLKKTGKRGGMNAILQTFVKQLEEFLDDSDEVQRNIDSFKTNISSLSSWVSDIKMQSLELDKIYLDSSELVLPDANASFFKKIVHEFKCFIASFLVDYNTIGESINDEDETIEVWVQSGRDQATIIKNLVTNSFTSEYCAGVDIKLVQNQLLAATASGRGPDVALQVAAADPVNYATRGAAYDLTNFKDYDEISLRFRASALVPYSFNEGIYALPETQTFQAMFYRADVLSELNIAVPKTWDEMFVVLGRLQKKNMTIGVPASTMTTLLYQRGGELYSENGDKSGLSSNEAQEAFALWCSMYRDYEAPVSYNALNRFRTGEMPIVIEDIAFFNTLQASAPEIQGMWEFASVPGTFDETGKLHCEVAGGGIACMLLDACDNKRGAWDFLKWWTSEEIQTKYGREIENRLGLSARYASANVEAFESMPWTVSELTTLNKLWKNVKGVPEVAGGYFTSRHLNNAFRRVINYGEDARTTLLDYAEKIDKEITNKRNELGIK